VNITRAADLLAKAQRPVMVCGGGIHLSRAYSEVQALAEMLTMPVATSINGKGALPESHPLSLGVIGANGGRAFAHTIVQDSDLILFVGTRVNYVTANDWRTPPKNYAGKIIQIDVDGNEIGNNLRVAVGLVGDAQLALSDLRAALNAQAHPLPPHNAARLVAIRQAQSAWWATQQPKMVSDEKPIRPQRVIRTLQELLPEDTIIVADPGTATPFVAAHYPLCCGGRYTVIPRAHGGLGYGIPALLGAKIAKPNQTVICLTGDGSFGFSVGELETIVRQGLKVIVLQFNNGTFGWIKELQHVHHDNRYFGVDFLQQDCAEIARGFGWHGIRVEEPDDLAPAIREALLADKPTFIDVISADQIAETPPVIGWQEAEAKQHAT
jgi:acetolactate synthase-1/2/3 large subunit